MENKYKIIYCGEKQEHFNVDYFIKQFTQKYGTKAKAEKLLHITKDTLLKKNLSQDEAKSYQDNMHKMGLVIRIEKQPNENPYQVPQAELVSESPVFTHQVPFLNGLQWLTNALSLIFRFPVTWLFLILLYFFVLGAISLIPMAGSFLMYFLGPVFMAGFMVGCQDSFHDEKLKIRHLFSGFNHNPSSLVLVGVIYFFALVVIMILSVGLGFLILPIDMSALGEEPSMIIQALMTPQFAIVILVAFGLMILPYAAIWFAPALIALDGKEAITAMKMSFSACFKNILPMIAYGFAMLFFYILLFIPIIAALWMVLKMQGLALNQATLLMTTAKGVLICILIYFIISVLLMTAVLIASSYTSYRDIFHNE